jgi:4a-hydroxytetrahydrobiopterin dehydratase
MPAKLSPSEVAEAGKRLGDWQPDSDKSLTHTFTFADHITAMGFVVRVAMAAEVLNHHPDLRIVYNRVEISLSTHDAGGVTEKDLALAERINVFAR